MQVPFLAPKTAEHSHVQLRVKAGLFNFNCEKIITNIKYICLPMSPTSAGHWKITLPPNRNARHHGAAPTLNVAGMTRQENGK